MGDIERQNTHDDMTRRVVRVANHKSVFCVVFLAFKSDESRVRRNGRLNLFENLAEVLILIEKKNRRFCIAPRYIPKQLIKRFAQRFLAAPELTFRGENRFTLVTNLDVCLALVAERLRGRIAFVYGVERYEKMKTDFLFR